MDQLLQAAADPAMAQVIRILDAIRNLLVGILTALAMVALTYAGVRYVLSSADPSGIEKAKMAVKSAVIGFALALLAPLVIAIVKNVLGG